MNTKLRGFKMGQKQVIKEYSIKPDQLFSLATDAVTKLGWLVVQQNKSDGFINFRTKWLTLEVSIFISETPTNGSKIVFSGGTLTGGKFFLFGTHYMNQAAKKSFKVIDERVKKGDVPAHKPSTNSAVATSSADELKKLSDLVTQGILTQAEFDAKKKQLLGL